LPGEIENRNSARLSQAGIALADTTWHSSTKLKVKPRLSDWIFEPKLDGYRAIAGIDSARCIGAAMQDFRSF